MLQITATFSASIYSSTILPSVSLAGASSSQQTSVRPSDKNHDPYPCIVINIALSNSACLDSPASGEKLDCNV
jgi:hypothetical protein